MNEEISHYICCPISSTEGRKEGRKEGKGKKEGRKKGGKEGERENMRTEKRRQLLTALKFQLLTSHHLLHNDSEGSKVTTDL